MPTSAPLNVTNFLKNAHFCGVFCWGDVGIAPYDYKCRPVLTCDLLLGSLFLYMEEKIFPFIKKYIET